MAVMLIKKKRCKGRTEVNLTRKPLHASNDNDRQFR